MDDTKTKTVTVTWHEVHLGEFEVPEDLTTEEDILDWVLVWGKGDWNINTDWDSFAIE